MGIKQEELKALVQQENDAILAILETWWNDLHNWSAAVDCHKPFTKKRTNVGEALCVGECFDCLELNDDDSRESVYFKSQRER